jgi:hypothetical protein
MRHIRTHCVGADSVLLFIIMIIAAERATFGLNSVENSYHRELDTELPNTMKSRLLTHR